jgi:hypothetical protein
VVLGQRIAHSDDDQASDQGRQQREHPDRTVATAQHDQLPRKERPDRLAEIDARGADAEVAADAGTVGEYVNQHRPINSQVTAGPSLPTMFWMNSAGSVGQANGTAIEAVNSKEAEMTNGLWRHTRSEIQPVTSIEITVTAIVIAG